MNNKIKIGIAGGAGYTGGELLRILINHPFAEIVFVHSNSNAGNPVYQAHTDLFGDTELQFTDQFNWNIDVLFLCVGHGDAKKFLEANQVPAMVKIIDLSQDFRLKNSISGDRKWVYGLPEMNKAQICEAENIANPGCFATCLQLGMLPLAAMHLIKHELHVTAVTGSTGAGQKPSSTTHFSWRANNLSTYKSFEHQHLKEIKQSLVQLQPGEAPVVNFVPYRGDFARGIIASIYMDFEGNQDDAYNLYHHFYENHPFTHVSKNPIDLKQVVNTNKCLLSVEKHGNKILIMSVIDNLLKGASGQAVQNMNLMFGLDETTGLRLKPVAF
jgi:N-acetyl-gamma-glutamyl-phosphate reductase